LSIANCQLQIEAGISGSFCEAVLSDVAERQAIVGQRLKKFTPWQNWQETASIGKNRQVLARTGKYWQEPASTGKSRQEPARLEDWKNGRVEYWNDGRLEGRKNAAKPQAGVWLIGAWELFGIWDLSRRAGPRPECGGWWAGSFWQWRRRWA